VEVEASTVLRRVTLSDQVAEHLRQGILDGRWEGHLPSEAELCRELQISRVTIRRAIAQLTGAQWLSSGGRGSHHRICRQAGPHRPPSGNIVRVLVPCALPALGSTTNAWLNVLGERLGSAGYRLEFEQRPRLFRGHSPEALARLNALPGTRAWLLLSAPESMQTWFATERIPCLLADPGVAGLPLSSVFANQQAVGRHAAGLFYQRGHRDLACFLAEPADRNDQLCAEAFIQEAGRLGARGRIITHAADAASVRSALTRLLEARSAPTGFFPTRPEDGLTLLCHLQNAGLRVPADVSMIAAREDQFHRHTVPEFARYGVDGTKLGTKAAGILLDLIQHGAGKLRTISIMPEFIAGGTLDRVRADAA
jgi:LacI family transcriptional regulator